MTQRWNGLNMTAAARPAAEREDTGPEAALWAAVLVQAIKDACAVIASPKRAQAREWLLRGGQNFRLVCGGAGYEAARVRPAMERLAEAGWVSNLLKDKRGTHGFTGVRSV